MLITIRGFKLAGRETGAIEGKLDGIEIYLVSSASREAYFAHIV